MTSNVMGGILRPPRLVASRLTRHSEVYSVLSHAPYVRVLWRTGSPQTREMAGLTVRDPAVDRSLRSVFGERNSVTPSIGEGQKDTGSGEECSLHLMSRRGSRWWVGPAALLACLVGQPAWWSRGGKVMLPFPWDRAAFPRCGWGS